MPLFGSDSVVNDASNQALNFTPGFPNPSDYPASDFFRRKINTYLEKDGLDWYVDGNGNNFPNNGEVKKDGKILKELDDPTLKNINLAYIKYFADYLGFVKEVNKTYTLNELISLEALDKLNPYERELVTKLFYELGPLFNELYILQSNPNVPEYLKQLKADLVNNQLPFGAWNLISRIMLDSCPTPFFTDPLCSIYPIPPDKPAINGMNPLDMTPEEWQFIAKAYVQAGQEKSDIFLPNVVLDWSNGSKPKELIPLTNKKAGVDLLKEQITAKPNDKVLQQQQEKLEKEMISLEEKLLPSLVGCVKATLLPNHPRFSDICRRISDKAKEIADFSTMYDGFIYDVRTSNPALYHQMMTLSQDFATGNFVESLKASLEPSNEKVVIHFTPGTEAYWADNRSFAAMGTIGVNDPESRDVLDEISPLLLKELDGLAKEKTAYAGGDTKENVNVSTIEVVGYFGLLGGFEHGNAGGWEFPNFEYEDVHAKKIISASTIFTLRDIGPHTDEMLGAYGKLVTNLGDNIVVAGHESGHLTGPTKNYLIKDGPHAGKTMGAAFLSQWGRAEETKAMIAVLSAIKIGLENNKITVEQAREIVISLFNWTLNSITDERDIEKLKQDHDIAYTFVLGVLHEGGLYAFEDGKLTFKHSNPNDLSKEELISLSELGLDAFLKIVDFQARGDADGCTKYLQEKINLAPVGISAYADAAKVKHNVPKKSLMLFRIPRLDY